MRAYLFRGLAGTVFSTGIDRLAKKLQRAGIETSVHSWADRRQTETEAVQQYRKGKHTGPVVLVGHSLGANSANLMANHLVSRKIPVGYVATIDPTSSKPGPDGVSADNFRSWDPRARKIRGARQFKRRDLNHIQIDKDEEVHARILAMCLPETGNAKCGHTTLRSKSKKISANRYPVNNALGKTIGRLLNGKKTVTGLTSLMCLAAFQFLGGTTQALDAKSLSALQQLLAPLSVSLAGWGILGKAEKWVNSRQLADNRIAKI
ncbi:MAG: alpha/beta hydrolase [Pseudomonadota bacterium]